jgi:hypothetical protein
MKFIQTGSFKENSLEALVTMKPKERIQNILLEYLDYFVGFIATERPEITTNYVEKLVSKYQGLIEKDFWENSSDEIKSIYMQYKNLNQFPDLQKASLNYFVHLLRIKDQATWERNEVEISMEALIQAWIYPSYYFLQTLAETVDRKEAVNLFKRYITHFYIDHPSPNQDNFVSLEKRLEDRLLGNTTSSEWVIVHAMLKDGKYAFKNKNCPTCADATTNLTDVEFKYLVCCYGDYEKFRANLNDHIILTMEHTIIEGNPYCSRVLHDTRVDYDLRHPPKEFWDNFEPGKEEIAKKYYTR